ncbi:type II secretion system protein GspE [Gammaproteobacteria bacterium 53_120_T64]|nr:type II secretion system protein GspE [Gammaproteobacteria bacterium 53_120_T64]
MADQGEGGVLAEGSAEQSSSHLQADDELRAALLETGLLSAPDFARAQRVHSESSDESLVALLLRLGMVSERGMAKVQADMAGLSLLKPGDYPEQALETPLSLRFMKDQYLLPLAMRANTLDLAVADTTNAYSLRAVAMACHCELKLSVGLAPDIQAAIERLYEQPENSADEGGVQSAEFSAVDVAKLRDMASEAPVIRLVNQIIQRAVDSRASDIHVEPFEHNLKIRNRIDGVLRDEPSPPRELAPAVISRIKIMADLDIAERRLPQDGRINVRVQGQELDVRVSTVPTMYGESVVMRLLQRDSVTLDFDSLGFTPEQRARLQKELSMTHGMVIVTGPTGSGKTTTLYTALNSLNTEQRKVITVEDPVEYNLEGINQIQVNASIGLDFSSALRSIVRQDPDVIMVGEMRDLETARICVQSALTGHLVLSTLHTNDAAGSVTRLLEMGTEDYLLNSTLNVVLAQRLVRLLCQHCKQPYEAEARIVEEFELERILPVSQSLHLQKAVGCDHCANTGYRGRVGIIEILTISDNIRSLILRHASAGEIEAQAREEGMTTMFEDGCLKAAQGLTTLEEVARVIQES